MRSVETVTAVETSGEHAIPREIEVVYTGDDGHIYISEGDGRRSERLSWSTEDFSTLPGMPPLPGVCGNLEDGLVFTNPISSRDGERVAVFGLLPTLLEDREIYPWEPWMDDESVEDDEWEVSAMEPVDPPQRAPHHMRIATPPMGNSVMSLVPMPNRFAIRACPSS